MRNITELVLVILVGALTVPTLYGEERSDAAIKKAEEEAFLKSILDEPKGKGLNLLREDGDFKKLADKLIKEFDRVKDSDDFLKILKKKKIVFKELKVWDTTDRFVHVVIPFDEVYSFSVYYDKSTKKLLTYFLTVTFL